MLCDPFVQAKLRLERERWGQILGQVSDARERVVSREGNKEGHLLAFSSPLTDSKRRPPPYHILVRATIGSPGRRLGPN